MISRADDIATGILAYLKKSGQIKLLPDVVKQLNSKIKADKRKIVVESAVGLEVKEKKEIEKIIRNKWLADGVISYVINPKLIGGMKIFIGDQVMDLSVLGKFEKIYDQV